MAPHTRPHVQAPEVVLEHKCPKGNDHSPAELAQMLVDHLGRQGLLQAD